MRISALMRGKYSKNRPASPAHIQTGRAGESQNSAVNRNKKPQYYFYAGNKLLYNYIACYVCFRYTDYVIIKNPGNLVKVPQNMSMEVAALLPCGGLTAYTAIMRARPYIRDCEDRKGMDQFPMDHSITDTQTVVTQRKGSCLPVLFLFD